MYNQVYVSQVIDMVINSNSIEFQAKLENLKLGSTVYKRTFVLTIPNLLDYKYLHIPNDPMEGFGSGYCHQVYADAKKAAIEWIESNGYKLYGDRSTVAEIKMIIATD